MALQTFAMPLFRVSRRAPSSTLGRAREVGRGAGAVSSGSAVLPRGHGIWSLSGSALRAALGSPRGRAMARCAGTDRVQGSGGQSERRPAACIVTEVLRRMARHRNYGFGRPDLGALCRLAPSPRPRFHVMQIVSPDGSSKLAYGFVSGVFGCAPTGNNDEVCFHS